MFGVLLCSEGIVDDEEFVEPWGMSATRISIRAAPMLKIFIVFIFFINYFLNYTIIMLLNDF